jgi:hypothetical protein
VYGIAEDDSRGSLVSKTRKELQVKRPTLVRFRTEKKNCRRTRRGAECVCVCVFVIARCR